MKRGANAVAISLSVLALGAVSAPTAAASRTQWSIFEDSPHLVGTDPGTREATLEELQGLGVDTIRITLRWNAVAPGSESARKPAGFNPADPAAYPGFGPYDDLVRRATAKGIRVLVSVAGHAPRWARKGKSRNSAWLPDLQQFRLFAAATARRYSGTFGGLPKVGFWTIWNEPNQGGWLAPQSVCRGKKGHRRCAPYAPHYYRALVRAGYPAIKAADRGSKVFIGELAPSGSDFASSSRALRPLKFLRAFACRDVHYRRIRGGPCKGFKPARGDAFSHHPYAAYARFLSPRSGSRSRDDASMGDTRRLLRTVDKLRRLGGIKLVDRRHIYYTEFGLQTNPPDPFQPASLAVQARFINEAEAYTYRLSRIASYSQYLLYDEPPLPGPKQVRWGGFQMGLRFFDGRLKPSYEAYRLPLVVKRSGHRSVIWGRVRPGSGPRFVQLQRLAGGHFVNAGARIKTDSLGYFKARRGLGTYRFDGYVSQGGSGASGASLKFVGRSRSAAR